MPERQRHAAAAPDQRRARAAAGLAGHLRTSILRKLDGLSEEQARWTPDGALLPVLGVVNHLTPSSGARSTGRCSAPRPSRSEAEFRPGPELTAADAAPAPGARRGDRRDGALAAA